MSSTERQKTGWWRGRQNKAGKTADAAAQKQDTEEQIEMVEDTPETVGNPDGELVAIFAAAITQLRGAGTPKFRVVAYRKTGQNSPVWNIRGRNDYLSGKL